MTEVYKQCEGYTCGPSAYMESFLKGNKSKAMEMRLHHLGRVNPSRIFLGPSFLKLDPALNLYTTNLGLTEGVLNLTHNPEIREFREKMSKNYSEMIKSYLSRIHTIKGAEDIKEILNQTADEGRKALLLTHSGHWLKEGGPHWVSVLGKEGAYKIGDPRTGKVLDFSESDLEKTLKMLKGIDFPLEVVTDFKVKK